jgi:SAM-dependent methyltransferase
MTERAVERSGLPTAGTTPILEGALGMLRAGAPRPGRLADIPCGTGYLSVRAAACGWRVSPLDIDPTLWEGGDVAKASHADLNLPLPLDDDVFDAVACCEGIEHIENPWLVLREFRRVLRPCGLAIVSLPNTIDLRQRLRILRRGFYGHYLPNVLDHINFIGTFGLCHALIRTGFEIEDVNVPKVYGGPFMRAATRVLRFGRRAGLPENVRAMLSSPRVLCGRTAVIRARLPADSSSAD